ncbi:hypothetical protein K491DRAFT_721588 [Lophiostoma macrostomum CBS 122681]|uniref:Uncharacterized protein n=1 Tax=Lophiostoma macrostomum CBS 122681 TaxID=1314788 RepID=A0A6A6SRC5_9PLEO|nr:hypothetical protein K491DRAFT_721588 [Lophiostoma macrostomum CBS 122681]
MTAIRISPNDKEIGPAWNEILASMSNMHRFYKSIVHDAFAEDKTDATIDAFNLALNGVEYKKEDTTLETIADIVGVVLMPVGGGVMVTSMIRQGVSAAAARVAQLSGDFQAFWQKAQQGFNVQSAAFGVEMANMASEALANGKDPVEGALSEIREISDFVTLGSNTFTYWENSLKNATSNIFTGKMKEDEDIGGGVSNMASLLHALDDGAWIDGLSTENVQQAAISQYLAHALPLAELQNDAVRPTIIMRPYACDDTNRAKQDSVVQEWIKAFSSDVTVSLSDAPGVCFLVLDANKDAHTTECCYTNIQLPHMAELNGINHKTMDHTSGAINPPWGDITIEDYVNSTYLAWKNNGNKNIARTTDLGSSWPSDGDVAWFNPLNIPGEWSSYFVICGTDDTNAVLDAQKTPDEIKLVLDNLESALYDWSWADRKTRDFPCAANPPRAFP